MTSAISTNLVVYSPEEPLPPPSEKQLLLQPVTEALSCVATFFSSSEEYYEDPLSKIKYYKPNSQAPLLMALELFSEGGYRGAGINKEQKLPNPKRSNRHLCCDVIYFRKTQQQIFFETKGWKSFLGATFNILNNLKEDQEVLKEKIKSYVKENYKNWNYDHFAFHPSPKSEKWFSEEDAKEIHALILFYKVFKFPTGFFETQVEEVKAQSNVKEPYSPAFTGSITGDFLSSLNFTKDTK